MPNIPRISLRLRIITLLAAMVAIVLLGALGATWQMHQTISRMSQLIDREFILYQTAKEMELALSNQKGYVTYYLVDGESKWLDALQDYRQDFHASLEKAKKFELSEAQQQLVGRIGQEYVNYIVAKDMAITSYQRGDSQGSISAQHARHRNIFFPLLELCRAFSQEQWQTILRVKKEIMQQTEKMEYAVYVTVAIFLLLFILLLVLLYTQILEPIRGLAIETGSTPQASSKDEVGSLAAGLKRMMDEFDHTHDQLEKSRGHLLQAERMAMVGELAAGVAHTIRNPFTSIKMRMFSLTKALTLDEAQSEDLKVIADEINRIDRIVQNFLEFARPPKLSLALCSISRLLGDVAILLEFRLKQYHAQLEILPLPDAPPVLVDVDRIKEALVNLVSNACEALADGGKITLRETRGRDDNYGQVLILAVEDSGCGMATSLIHKVTAPFFTTKENGSGLGLSIVNRIVREHRGKLKIVSQPGKGTEITMTLPIGEASVADTDH